MAVTIRSFLTSLVCRVAHFLFPVLPPCPACARCSRTSLPASCGWALQRSPAAPCSTGSVDRKGLIAVSGSARMSRITLAPFWLAMPVRPGFDAVCGVCSGLVSVGSTEKTRWATRSAATQHTVRAVVAALAACAGMFRGHKAIQMRSLRPVADSLVSPVVSALPAFSLLPGIAVPLLRRDVRNVRQGFCCHLCAPPNT